jgi:hypothetical protein
MDHAANKNEVRLRKGESLKERLAVSGLAILVCLFAVPDLVVGQRPSITAIIALLIGCLLLASAILRRNVVWIITPAGILIGEQRPFRRLRSRLIEETKFQRCISGRIAPIQQYSASLSRLDRGKS